jgi:tetratricopeptide (TPR) repeat protein
MMLRIFLIQAFCFFIFSAVSAQEANLAATYFRDGEFEKAAALYEKLYKQHNYNDYYFTQFYKSLLSLGDFNRCEKEIDAFLKAKPKEIHLFVHKGNLFEIQGRESEAKKWYDHAMKQLGDVRQVQMVANTFMSYNKLDYAKETYEKGIQLTNDETQFASNLAELYRRSGKLDQMVKYYIVFAKNSPNNLNYIKQVLQINMSDSLSMFLENTLYSRLQMEPEEVIYPDLLGWLFMNNKEYAKALRQYIALDKRLGENGSRVFELANAAEKDEDYGTAIRAYRYLSEEKSGTNSYKIDSKRKMLYCMRQQINISAAIEPSELLAIDSTYSEALQKLGLNNSTAELSLEYANFLAYYRNDLPKAISILQELISRKELNDRIVARAKLDLGDLYLITEEIWEGSLLFSQVDKAFQEGFLGELARFKNAKLFYYNGEFEWAKIQLDVLKRSTSKLISNDAIDISVFIAENTGLDSTTVALGMYAKAELLCVQHKYNEAFTKLDSILFMFPDHELEDDVFYLKARTYSELKDYNTAILFYTKIIEGHVEDIRGDNALFELASLYETVLNDPEKAKKLYEKIFMEHADSTFAIEARQRYRDLSEHTLTGDQLPGEEKFMRGIQTP